jgi:hypothetical protein
MKQIGKALLEFQRLVAPIGKGTVNPFFKKKYATLDTIQESIKPHLIGCGLVVVQGIDETGSLKSQLIHVESGESVSSYFPVVVTKADAQSYGSAVSYAKRYSLVALLNLTIEDEDDDGNHASDKGKAVTETKQPTNELPWLNENEPVFASAVKKLQSGATTIEKIKKVYRLSKKTEEALNKALQPQTA